MLLALLSLSNFVPGARHSLPTRYKLTSTTGHGIRYSPTRRHDNRHGALPRDPMLCKYLSLKCRKQRMRKPTGELHSLCEKHREKANAAQRKSQLAKKLRLMTDFSGSQSLTTGASNWIALRVDRSLKCGYSKGQGCNDQRAIKPNGSRHRFCERHREQAKGHQRTHIQSQRDRLEARSQHELGVETNLTSQGLHIIGFMPPLQLNAFLEGRRLGHLSREGISMLDGIGSGDLSSDLHHEVQFQGAFHVLVDNVQHGEAKALLAHVNPWLWDFVEDVYESLNDEQ